MTLRLITVLFAIPLLSAALRAETLHVPSASFETIQSAIDAAAPGDKILIQKGSYNERLIVHSGLDGLEIVGRGQVFVDAQTPPDLEELGDGGLSSVGLLILSNDVTVRKITFRHAPGAGVMSLVPSLGGGQVSGLRLLRVDVLGCGRSGAAGMDLAAHDALIQGCRLVGNGGGLKIDGSSATVQRSRVLGVAGFAAPSGGLRIVGSDGRVENCVVERVPFGVGVHVSGASASIVRSSVQSAGGGGILVDSGAGHVVDRNQVSDVNGVGIEVSGEGSLLQRNVVEGASAAGIVFEGDDSQLIANRTTDIYAYGEGYQVSGQGLEISKNSAEQSAACGMSLVVSSSAIVGNRAMHNGSDAETGIYVIGDVNFISDNRTDANISTGLKIAGNENEIRANVSRGNLDNGIALVDGASNVLEDNVTMANHGDGLEIFGEETGLRGNRSLGNLQDLSVVKEGLAIDDGGNVFETGGFASPPLVGSGY